MALAVIGGSGLMDLALLEHGRDHRWQTPYGAPSSPVQEGMLDGHRLLFLARHGRGQHLAPHVVNYRANIAALAELGASGVLAVNIVGGITPRMVPGAWVVPDQLIDYSWGRHHTFYDGSNGAVEHVEFADPFDAGLRRLVTELAEAQGLAPCQSGTYGCTQGPRLETAAEIVRLERDGCDVVGMTAMPEAALAREKQLPYAALCVVVNRAAGKGEGPISAASIAAVVASAMQALPALLAALVPALAAPSAR